MLSPNIIRLPLELRYPFCNDNPELVTSSLELPPVFNSIVSPAEKWTKVCVSPSCNKAPAVITSLAVIDPLKSSAVPDELVIEAPPILISSALTVPATSNNCVGISLPIPTLPLSSLRAWIIVPPAPTCKPPFAVTIPTDST